jgi:hypothetical protein
MVVLTNNEKRAIIKTENNNFFCSLLTRRDRDMNSATKCGGGDAVTNFAICFGAGILLVGAALIWQLIRQPVIELLHNMGVL